MKKLIAILLLLLATPAWSQIVVQSVYPEHVLGEMDCEPEVEGEFSYINKQWSFTPAKISSKQQADGSLVFTGPPGKYTIRCKLVVGQKTDEGILIKDPDKQIREYMTELTIMGKVQPDPTPFPDPIPDPSPNPDPVPPPVTIDGAWIILVEESEDRGKNIDWLLVQQNTAVWQSLNDKGFKWRWYDDDSADASRYLKDVESVGVPALLVYDKSGNLLGRKKASEIKSRDDFNKFIKETTGK
jgi:hypothetical protein